MLSIVLNSMQSSDLWLFHLHTVLPPWRYCQKVAHNYSLVWALRAFGKLNSKMSNWQKFCRVGFLIVSKVWGPRFGRIPIWVLVKPAQRTPAAVLLVPLVCVPSFSSFGSACPALLIEILEEAWHWGLPR